VSASLTLEDLHMVKRLFTEMIPSARIVVPGKFRGKDDEILIRADKNANAAGARLLGLTMDDDHRQLDALMADAAAGRVELLLVLGVEGLDLAAAGENTFVAVFSPFATGAAAQADLALPAVGFGEFVGTWVNFQGRAQIVRQAVIPHAVALEGWKLMAELMRRLGAVVPHRTPGDVLAELAASAPNLSVLKTRVMSYAGVQVPA
jgi:NADH dehydrogenase/NADH:ubiquinone oxidoreductase subunit G